MVFFSVFFSWNRASLTGKLVFFLWKITLSKSWWNEWVLVTWWQQIRPQIWRLCLPVNAKTARQEQSTWKVEIGWLKSSQALVQGMNIKGTGGIVLLLCIAEHFASLFSLRGEYLQKGCTESYSLACSLALLLAATIGHLCSNCSSSASSDVISVSWGVSRLEQVTPEHFKSREITN